MLRIDSLLLGNVSLLRMLGSRLQTSRNDDMLVDLEVSDALPKCDVAAMGSSMPHTI